MSQCHCVINLYKLSPLPRLLCINIPVYLLACYIPLSPSLFHSYLFISSLSLSLDLPPLVISVTPSITAARISWSRSPNSQYDSLKYYVVYYAVEALLSSARLPNDTEGFQSKNFTKDSTSGTVSGLEEGVVYVFLGSYYADNTMSRISSPVLVQTLSSKCMMYSKISISVNHGFMENVLNVY